MDLSLYCLDNSEDRITWPEGGEITMAKKLAWLETGKDYLFAHWSLLLAIIISAIAYSAMIGVVRIDAILATIFIIGHLVFSIIVLLLSAFKPGYQPNQVAVYYAAIICLAAFIWAVVTLISPEKIQEATGLVQAIVSEENGIIKND